MNWYTDQQIKDFLSRKDYDIAKSGNGRWIDQKCTPDVVAIIADCVLEYSSAHPDKEYFSSMDIWHNDYTVNNVEAIFKKPNANGGAARNEYDKFFQQPLEMLSYAGVIEKKKDGNRNFYKVTDTSLLQFISMREMNALKFIVLYCEKVLGDSGLMLIFERFFARPTPESYDDMKKTFASFVQKHTPINGDLECNRIFTKVLNPIAFLRGTYGTERGTLSHGKITKDMLMYNRNNFRDIYADKPKELTRKQYQQLIGFKPNPNYNKYQSNKMKSLLRSFNDRFRNGKSEVYDENELSIATQMHHIFPSSQFEEISGYIENIIALTPNQHFTMAHPNNNTRIINRAFQQICLIAKAGSIKDNIEHGEDVIYAFDNFTYVLSVGFENEGYEDIEDGDYDEAIRMINMEYVESNA